jgi:hypothetical protein
MAKHCPVACRNVKEPVVNMKECKDLHPRCPIWTDFGECEENPRDMNRFCRKSCKACGEDSDVDESSLCVDKNETCAYWGSLGECKANPRYMSINCAKTCNVCEKPEGVAKKTAPGTKKNERRDRLLEWSELVGVRQTATGSDVEATLDKIQQSKDYWERDATEALPADLMAKCRNLNELCTFWAQIGRWKDRLFVREGNRRMNSTQFLFGCVE